MVSAQGYCKYGFLFISIYLEVFKLYTLSDIIVSNTEILE